MLRKLAMAAVVMMVSVGFVYAEEFTAVIRKVDGRKIEITKVKKGEKGDEATLTLADNVKVTRGKFNKETKGVEAGDPLPDGVKNEIFAKSEKGVFARIVTADDGKVTEIRVLQFGGGKKKKKDAQ